MWMTDHALYGPTPITGWVDVGTPTPIDAGQVAFVKDGKYLSARAGGELIWVTRDGPDANERFTVADNFAKVTIGEGLRVYGVA